MHFKPAKTPYIVENTFIKINKSFLVRRNLKNTWRNWQNLTKLAKSDETDKIWQYWRNWQNQTMLTKMTKSDNTDENDKTDKNWMNVFLEVSSQKGSLIDRWIELKHLWGGHEIFGRFSELRESEFAEQNGLEQVQLESWSPAAFHKGDLAEHPFNFGIGDRQAQHSKNARWERTEREIASGILKVVHFTPEGLGAGWGEALSFQQLGLFLDFSQS